jgi:hypothetical protein
MLPLNSIFNFLSYLDSFIFLIGLFGNATSFIVFSRETFRRNSISTYCRALAISDSFILITFIDKAYYVLMNDDLVTKSNIICKMLWFANTGLSPISGWVLTAFSLDKMICVLNTARFGFIKKKSYQLLLILGIALANCAIYLVGPIKLKVSSLENRTYLSCDLQDLSFYKVLNSVYIVQAIIVPFCCMIISTSVILNCLFKSRRKIEKSLSQEMKERKVRDVKFAINSVILSLLFIILEMPITVCYLIGFEFLNPLVVAVSAMLFYSNYSVSFFTYLIFNSVFRNEFLSLILRKRQISPKNDRKLTTVAVDK